MMRKKNGPVAGQKIPRQKKRDFISPGTVVLRADQSTPSHEKCPTVGIAAPVEGTGSPSSIEEAHHILQAILQSTSDGILAVNEDNEVLFANERFAKMWRIPQEIMASKDDNLLLQFVLDQLSDPQSFLQKVKELYRSAEENFDTLYFKDGRVFERRTSPILQQTKLRGRVWSFQEITEGKQVQEELRRAKDDHEAILIKLQESLEREKQLANTDGLTGLCNHRHFFERAEHEFQTAVRYPHPLSFVMFDIDYFKQVNDTLGHAAGDRLLAEVAQIAAAQVRASDLVARYGGDEFIVALPYTSAQQALAVTERIQKSVAAISVDMVRSDHEPFAITISIGIAEMRCKATDDNVERIIQRADDALYEAKRSGRNRAVIHDL